MAKLNQIVAVVNGKKTETVKALTALHRKCQATELFNGLHKTYRPLDEEGETFPDEGKVVELKSTEVLDSCKDIMGSLMDIIATQDYANGDAKADIKVDGETVLEQVPVTYLLFLEKQLNDLHKFVDTIPTLSVSDNWVWDDNKGMYVTPPQETNKTKKLNQHKVVYEATKEHPAQVVSYTEDVVVGKWSNVKFSGAMPVMKKKEILDRIKKLEDAVKFSREEANSIDVKQQVVSDKLFRYLFQ